MDLLFLWTHAFTCFNVLVHVDSQKTPEQREHENQVLQEMLDVVDMRDSLVAFLEEKRLKEVNDELLGNSVLEAKRHSIAASQVLWDWDATNTCFFWTPQHLNRVLHHKAPHLLILVPLQTYYDLLSFVENKKKKLHDLFSIQKNWTVTKGRQAARRTKSTIKSWLMWSFIRRSYKSQFSVLNHSF